MSKSDNNEGSSKIPILIVDDEVHTRLALTKLLERENFLPFSAGSGEEALKILKKENIDIVITDLKLPNMNGIDLLKNIKETAPHICTLLITGHATIKTAVTAIKEGAYDYILKPLKFDELKKVIDKALDQQRLINENTYLKKLLYGKYDFSNIIGKSLAMQEVFNVMEKVADQDCSILILGNSGTGKELVAKAVHYNSSRRDNKFVAINCGSIPHNLLESELFGHVKGAFTGAHATKVGKFEYADNGTIFLDEIGNMSPALQVKLLRVLQEKEIVKVGDTKSKKIDVRVVSATNANLTEAIKNGTFREDLYYRLDIVQLNLPTLEKRKGDVPLLAKYFLKKYSKKIKNKKVIIDDSAIKLLEAYDFPGNVRELENMIERAIILCDDNKITEKDFPQNVRSKALIPKASRVKSDKHTTTGIDLNSELAKFEKELIKNAMALHKGTKSKAAKFLNINRTTLVEKLKRMEISFN